MSVKSRWRTLGLVCAACLLLKLDLANSSQEIMKNLTTGFIKVLDDCKKELNLPDHVMQDFYNFWKEDYQLVNRDMGCAVMCMASKFELLTDDWKVHHGNAQEFAKKHGASEDMAKQLVTIIHDCEKSHTGIMDDCTRTLEITKCFKNKIHELKWAPSMEIMLEEVMTEI